MMQEDSNGESTFEFVDQKADDASISEDTTNKGLCCKLFTFARCS